MPADQQDTPTIARHRAAIRRDDLSLPVKCLLRDQLLAAGGSFFDRGCGHGQDVQQLRERGVDSAGWDAGDEAERLRLRLQVTIPCQCSAVTNRCK